MSGVDARAQLVSQPAFVLHSRPWRDTSLLVDVLTARQGRLALIARGVSSMKNHALRAALQPWQFIALEYLLRGELGHLRSADPLDTAPRLSGAALLAGFYANELLIRLVPRQDPLPALFRSYAELRLQLGEGHDLAWALRRFERDLLIEIGFGLDLLHDCSGSPVKAGSWYWIDPEQGLVEATGSTSAPCFLGTAAIHLAQDVRPERKELASLRLPMRSVIAFHLGAKGLQAWKMAAALEKS